MFETIYGILFGLEIFQYVSKFIEILGLIENLSTLWSNRPELHDAQLVGDLHCSTTSRHLCPSVVIVCIRHVDVQRTQIAGQTILTCCTRTINYLSSLDFSLDTFLQSVVRNSFLQQFLHVSDCSFAIRHFRAVSDHIKRLRRSISLIRIVKLQKLRRLASSTWRSWRRVITLHASQLSLFAMFCTKWCAPSSHISNAVLTESLSFLCLSLSTFSNLSTSSSRKISHISRPMIFNIAALAHVFFILGVERIWSNSCDANVPKRRYKSWASSRHATTREYRVQLSCLQIQDQRLSPSALWLMRLPWLRLLDLVVFAELLTSRSTQWSKLLSWANMLRFVVIQRKMLLTFRYFTITDVAQALHC